MERIAESRSTAAPLAFVLIVAFATALAISLSDPPPARNRPGAFNAQRAYADLRDVLRESKPHPVGSPANRIVRDRIIAKLSALGLQPRIEPGYGCNPHGSCGEVENIVATMGPAGTKAILLTAHYDSVGAGPGAADDGMGVATLLETARLLRGEPLRHPLTILVTDGEEAGLLGAYAFAASPAMKTIGAVINIEARGTRGHSIMFETGRGDAKMVRAMRRSLERPSTGSLFVAIYKQLPNDTDFSVYKRLGLPGVNFANIDGVTRYHTRRDDLENFSVRTLQHHGDGVVSMIRALQTENLEALPAEGDATFFDLFGRTIVMWPERANIFAAITILALTLLLSLWSVKSRRVGVLRIFAGLLIPLLAAALAAALGWGVLYLLRQMGVAPGVWLADPRAAITAFWLVSSLAVLLVARIPMTSATHPLSLGSAVLFSVLSIALAVALPGATYVALLPALLFLIAGILTVRGVWLEPLAAAFVLTGISLLWLPLLMDLYDALGLPMMPAVSALIALCLMSGVPLLARASRRAWSVLMLGSAALLVLVLAVAFSRPPYDEANPRAMNVVAVQQDDGRLPRLLVVPADDELPLSMRQALRLARAPEGPPWNRGAWTGPSAMKPFPVPEVTVLKQEVKDGQLHLIVRQRSLRGGTAARLFVRAEGEPLVSLRGRPLKARMRSGAKGWRVYQESTLPPEGVVWDVTFRTSHAEVWLGDALRSAAGIDRRAVVTRDAHASPFGFGDYSFAVRRLWPVTPR